jgi:hypothetical protein
MTDPNTIAEAARAQAVARYESSRRQEQSKLIGELIDVSQQLSVARREDLHRGVAAARCVHGGLRVGGAVSSIKAGRRRGSRRRARNVKPLLACEGHAESWTWTHAGIEFSEGARMLDAISNEFCRVVDVFRKEPYCVHVIYDDGRNGFVEGDNIAALMPTTR